MSTPAFFIVTALTFCIAGPLTAQESSNSVASTEPEVVQPKTWVDDYEALLQKYVTANGVRYKAWHGSKTDLAKLATVVTSISKQSLSGKDREERLAFYLNAYNAWILHRILTDYPTDGPGGGGFFGRNSFFKSDDITVAGNETSFHDLENELIRPKFNEPRIHFALNCASKSCPPLHTKAFRKQTLDATLTSLTTAFVNSRSGVSLAKDGKKVAISKIFDWYEDDFRGGPVAYINRFRKEKLSTRVKVSYQDYSWNLNEAR